VADQNFRVKNGLNVGTAVTITTNEYQVGSTRIHSSGVEAKSLTVTDQTGISTIPALKLTGALYDTYNNVGAGNSVLISTGIGVSWIDIPTAALQGVQGTQGTQGVQGVQGTQGSQGVQGIQGVQGTFGTQGIQGIIGAQGFNGTLGSQGTQGTQGITGTQGIQGIQGTTGPQGITGAQGTTGTQGTTGIQGTTGAQGTTGTQGITGTQGTNGSQGTTGAQGATGSQGTTGSTGAQGITGGTGAQGATGPTGGSNTQILYNSGGTATGSANMTFDGTRPTFATLRTDSILPSGGLPAGASGGGIIQIVSTTKTDTFTTSNSSLTDVTGMSVSITPRSSSNKILVSLNLCFIGNNATNAYASLVRNSTIIAVGDAAGSRVRFTLSDYQGSASSNQSPTSSIVFLDSPSTTSATTYKVQVQTQGAGTVYVNRPQLYTDGAASGTGISVITVMEVSG
jgi:hypothetical protein